MGFSDAEQVQVKREFLRMLVRLQLDPAKMQLITGFFETYVTLNEREEKALKKEIETLEQTEQEAIFRIETSWERKGRIEGKAEGRIEGMAEGKIEGKLEGKLEAKMTVARRMLEHGMSVDEIVTLTELSHDEVAKLHR